MKKVGMVGVGCISGIYLENLTTRFRNVNVYCVCDLAEDKAKAQAEKYGIERIMTFDEILADPAIEIVLNITTPQTHYSLSKKALEAGKHVYMEKPLSLNYEQGKELVALAAEKGLLVGCAPDTFLGAGIQTCRRIIDEGVIGDIIGATAFMMCHGHESWHPDPEFYYKRGGGPMFDMGPYYLTALVNLLGPVEYVAGMTSMATPTRTITSQPKNGTVIDVEVPTHVNGMLRFDSGAIGTITTTFDVHYDKQASLEIYGTQGTLRVPDPNGFGGPIQLLRPEDGSFKEIPLAFDYKENSRGLGLADMAKAIQTGRRPRADYSQTLHVLEIMTAIEKSSQEKKVIELETSYERAAAMRNDMVRGILD